VIQRADVTGLILCGGAGVRLGGRDKPLELLGGVPLVEHVRARLQPQVARILISCNRNFEEYARWNDTIVADETANRGPLGGILAGMQLAETDYLFVCPGDAPFLSTTLIQRLTTALDREAVDLAIPRDGTRRQHLFPLMRRALAGPLSGYLQSGGRSVYAFIDQQRAAVIDASLERDAFFNVNSPADLRTAEAILRRSAARQP
jgi:molybdopterin-guanine dinucleotide biosynthesis protein A